MDRPRFYLVEGLSGEMDNAKLEVVFLERGERVSLLPLASVDETLLKIRGNPLSFVIACDDQMELGGPVTFFKNDGFGPKDMPFKAGVRYICYPPSTEEDPSQQFYRALARSIVETARQSLTP